MDVDGAVPLPKTQTPAPLVPTAVAPAIRTLGDAAPVELPKILNPSVNVPADLAKILVTDVSEPAVGVPLHWVLTNAA